jgi:hypothetical protein
MDLRRTISSKESRELEVMAHFAEIKSDDNEILRVVVISNDDVDANGGENSVEAETWVANNMDPDELIKQRLGGTYPSTYWKQTSYNDNFRGRFARVGGTYDSVNDVFVEIKPFPSWILDDDKCQWKSPVDKPDHTGYRSCVWYEEDQKWKATNEEGVLHIHDGSNWVVEDTE